MTELVTVPYKFTPRDYQLELFRALDGLKGQPKTKKKRAILRWHRRAGKDKACFCYLAKEAYQHAGNYFYIFPTAADARKALWENIDPLTGMKIMDHIPASIMKINNQEMKITLQTMDGKESTIRIVGYDTNPDSMRGTACKGAVVSEAAFSDPEVLKVLMPSLLQADGFLILNSTPNGRNHYYDLWMNVHDNDNWFVSERQTFWPDRANYTGYESPENLKELIDTGIHTEEDVEREFGVSFDTGMKGSIYGFQLDQAREQGRIGTYPVNLDRPVDTIQDIGQNDTTAIWFAQNDGGVVKFVDFWEGNRQGTDSIVKMLANKGYTYKNHVLPHDADHQHQGREVTSYAESFRESLDAFDCTGEVVVLDRITDKNMSIIATRQRMAIYCWDSFKCAVGLRHIELYHREYDKKRKTFLTTPAHDEHSNAADALRYESESSVTRRTGTLRFQETLTYANTGTYNVWD